ncbi:MAG: FAD-binding protein, partial [Clostridiales bacterium]|nr:FAD-binding protein [Clostridiales bacterium]
MSMTYGRENHKADVLVIGSGIGGLTAAVSIKE